MSRDRTEIYKIMSDMLDNPDKSGIYPTSTAYTRLELYVNQERTQAIGWAFAYCCSLLDQGKDPRTIEIPTFLDDAKKDLDM